MPNLNLLQKTQIVTLLEEGWSIRALAQRFEVNKSTILRVKRKWQQERDVQRKNGCGRKRVTTPEDDENLIQFLRNNPFESVVTAINRTNFPGHVRTARNRVRQDSEMRNRVAAEKPFLTADNKNQRIGLEFLPRDLNFWETVIFTDEKVFQSSYNCCVRVYRPPNSRYNEAYTSKSRKSGRF
ncbi:homeodomain-like domain [Holotrichia oblita]|uniref:Homeodomain-like domain n=1 Tax=Holotrichia oblita TaxID=644536 RepID=A0ACB9SPE0_HOLOL|nr:homeodomain-like domain [Holotrichia oblita]